MNTKETDCECGLTQEGVWSEELFDRYGCECDDMTNPPRQNFDKSPTLKPDKSPTLKRDKLTTLNPAYPCDTCGEPAMVVEMDRFFSCPECYIERLRDKIKRLDPAFNYH